MSTWSGPTFTVTEPGGAPHPWYLPAGGLPDGPLDLVLLGLSPQARLVVRWRWGSANPRSRRFAAVDPTWTDLVRDVSAARRARGVGWQAAPDGRPCRASEPADAPAPRRAPVPPAGVGPEAVVAVPAPQPAEVRAPAALWRTADPERRVWVSPHNQILTEVAAGAYGLGPTVAELAEDLKAARYARSRAKNRGNVSSVLSLVKQVLTYREPAAGDSAEVAAWKRARLALPGVQVGGSMHVRLLLVQDLDEAIAQRRGVDRRVARFNEQAEQRHRERWTRYLAAVQAKQAGTWRGGRLPARPPMELELRAQPEMTSGRTEQLFAQHLGAVLRLAESRGALVGPNPWQAFTEDPTRPKGYRTAETLLVNDRNVPPLGVVVALADAIAACGPWDPSRGCRTGARFRALVLLSTSGLRPSELAGLRPEDYRPGPTPRLRVYRSLTTAPAALNGGQDLHVSDRPKGRRRGAVREVELPRAVADALEAHLAAGYATAEHLFTGPRGGPLRTGAITATYWRPAVEQVLGGCAEPQLAQMEFRWLRKAALTWMLRAGRPVAEVAELAGHSEAVLLKHYAGVVPGHDERRTWTGWDDAWAWGVAETSLPGGAR